jgi:hypothetical protein
MTPRTIFSLFLLALIFPAQEFWQLWKGSNREVNWWIALDYPLSVQWYMKFAGLHMKDILLAIVLYRITYKIQALKMAAIVVLIYTSVDLIMFFVNFNKSPYTLIYATIGLVVMIIFCWKNIRKNLAHHPHHKIAS